MKEMRELMKGKMFAQMNGDFVNEYGSDVSQQRTTLVCEYLILSLIKGIKFKSMVTMAKIISEIMVLIAWEKGFNGHLVAAVSIFINKVYCKNRV